MSGWVTPLTFRRDCVTFTRVGVLAGWGQHVPRPCVLPAGRWRARRRKHKQVNVSVVRSSVLLVLSGSLCVSVPLLLAVLWGRSAPLRSLAGRAFFGRRFGYEFL